MFLRCHSRKKNGKLHRYWSVAESRRCRNQQPVQRQVLYLGEINDSQEAAWRKTIEVFDEQKKHYEQLSLFPSDGPIPPDEVNALSVVLTGLGLRHPRWFGDCWLGCVLWNELGLSGFWEAGLRSHRGKVPCYILRAYLPPEDTPEALTWEKQAPALWAWYTQLVHVEESFKTLKSDLNLRPIHHQIESRVQAHILVAFLAYCLTVTLRMKLTRAAPGLTPREVLRSLSAIQLVDVHIPITDGRELVMPRYTEPEAQQEIILEKLNLKLPKQPPPRIRSGEVLMPTDPPT